MNRNANRGRVLPWRAHEDEYLRAQYATMETRAIAFFLRRTIAGVLKRANRLGLGKQNSTRFTPGHTVGLSTRFAANNVPPNKGRRTKLRIWEKVEQLLAEHKELTQSDMAKLLEIPLGNLSGSLKQSPAHVCHIDRWTLAGKHWTAIYVGGPGANAEKPNQRVATAAVRARFIEEASKPQAIPRPALGPWGLAWGTQAGSAG